METLRIFLEASHDACFQICTYSQFRIIFPIHCQDTTIRQAAATSCHMLCGSASLQRSSPHNQSL